MRAKLRRAVEHEFTGQLVEVLQDFSQEGRSREGYPLYHFSPKENVHFFLLLDFDPEYDAFDVVVAEARASEYPWHVMTILPTDPPENGALVFSVGRLWHPLGESLIWRLVPEPALDDFDAWLAPIPPVSELLPKIPAVVSGCVAEFTPYLKAYLHQRIRQRDNT